MTYSIDECFVQTEFDALTGDHTANGLDQNFEKWRELKVEGRMKSAHRNRINLGEATMRSAQPEPSELTGPL